MECPLEAGGGAAAAMAMGFPKEGNEKREIPKHTFFLFDVLIHYTTQSAELRYTGYFVRLVCLWTTEPLSRLNSDHSLSGGVDKHIEQTKYTPWVRLSLERSRVRMAWH